MNKYKVGDCTNLQEDLVKEKMADKGNRRKVKYVLSEYRMEVCTELLEELEKDIEYEKSDGDGRCSDCGGRCSDDSQE